MDRTVLFLKSFSRDLERAKLLIDSIRQHNRDGLKTYVVIPQNERTLFVDKIGATDVNYLDEEQVAALNPGATGWVKQQLVKFAFHKLGLAAHYVVLDSDDTIIRDFHESDFVASDGRPYFVMNEAKERSRLALSVLSSDKEFAPMLWGVREQKQNIQSMMRRPGKMLYFQPAPIFVTKLLREFSREVLKPPQVTFEKLLAVSPFEADWIGEWIVKTRLSEVHPCEPMFLELQRSELVQFEKRLGVSLAELGQWYLGVRLCAGWNTQTTWG